MASAITQLTMRWPFVRPGIPGGAGIGVYGAAIPGLAYQGEVVRVNRSGGTLFPQLPDPVVVPPVEDAIQTIAVPPPPCSGMPLRAISIAPDSHWSACDLYPGGRISADNQWRITVGSPLVGELPTDFMGVSIVEAVPSISAVKNHVWDGTVFNHPDTGPLFAMPLRLRLWWGDIVPVIASERSVLHARWSTLVTTAGDNAIMYINVSGRRRIRVTAWTNAATTPTITIQQGIWRFALTSDGKLENSLLKVITGPTAIPTGATNAYIFEMGDEAGAGFATLPMDYIVVTVTDPTGSTELSAIDVKAWDA